LIQVSANFFSIKAYWIAQKAIKFVIDYEDNFLLDDENDENESIEAEVQELKKIIFDHFEVNADNIHLFHI
jgi:hypothetical protein